MRARSIIVGAATTVVVLVVIAAIIWPMFARTHCGDGHKPRCLTNLKSIGLAIKMYVNDNDEAYPPADRWCDALIPYSKNMSDFRCYLLPDARGAFAYNRRLSGVAERSINHPADVVMAFESRPGWDLSGGVELATCRHPEGFFVLYVDGHTQTLDCMSGLHWDPAYEPGQPAKGRKK